MKTGEKRNEIRAHSLQCEPWPPILVWDTSLLCFQCHHNSYSTSHRVPPRFGPFHQRSPPGGSTRCTRISSSTSLCRVTPKPSSLLPQLSPRIPCAPITKLHASEVHLTPDAPGTTQLLCSKLVIPHTEPLMCAWNTKEIHNTHKSEAAQEEQANRNKRCKTLCELNPDMWRTQTFLLPGRKA